MTPDLKSVQNNDNAIFLMLLFYSFAYFVLSSAPPSGVTHAKLARGPISKFLHRLLPHFTLSFAVHFYSQCNILASVVVAGSNYWRCCGCEIFMDWRPRQEAHNCCNSANSLVTFQGPTAIWIAHSSIIYWKYTFVSSSDALGTNVYDSLTWAGAEKAVDFSKLLYKRPPVALHNKLQPQNGII